MKQLERYEKYRKAGEQLHGKLADRALDHERALDTASLLGIQTDGAEVAYASEHEFFAHFECLLYEYPIDGRTAVDRYRSEVGGETPVEEDLLSAMVTSRTSLFRARGSDPITGTVTLSDMIEDVPDIELTDRNFAMNHSTNVAVFLRVLRFDEFAMSSGVAFPFPTGITDDLLSVYNDVREKTSRPDSLARFVTFYRLYKAHGDPIRMAPVTENSE